MQSNITPYNFKKVLAGVMLVAVPVFVACEKDPVKPDQPSQPQKHNVELKYDGRTNGGCVNIAMDTICKYNADPTVDSIFMIPDPNTQFATFNVQQMTNVVKTLRPRHNVNPNKVFGKGDLVLNGMVINGNPEIVRFFADTLKYNVR